MSDLERITVIVVRAKLLRSRRPLLHPALYNLSNWGAADCEAAVAIGPAVLSFDTWEMLLDEADNE